MNMLSGLSLNFSTSIMHQVYFDNFFTSCDLLMKLRGIEFRATGTVQDGILGVGPEKNKFTKKDYDKDHDNYW